MHIPKIVLVKEIIPISSRKVLGTEIETQRSKDDYSIFEFFNESVDNLKNVNLSIFYEGENTIEMEFFSIDTEDLRIPHFKISWRNIETSKVEGGFTTEAVSIKRRGYFYIRVKGLIGKNGNFELVLSRDGVILTRFNNYLEENRNNRGSLFKKL